MLTTPLFIPSKSNVWTFHGKFKLRVEVGREVPKLGTQFETSQRTSNELSTFQRNCAVNLGPEFRAVNGGSQIVARLYCILFLCTRFEIRSVHSWFSSPTFNSEFYITNFSIWVSNSELYIPDKIPWILNSNLGILNPRLSVHFQEMHLFNFELLHICLGMYEYTLCLDVQIYSNKKLIHILDDVVLGCTRLAGQLSMVHRS